MTANAMPGDRETCLAAGMDEYLSKPLSLAKLRDALEHDRPVQAPAVAAGGPGPAEAPMLDLAILGELRQLQLEGDGPAALGRLVDEFLARAAGLLAQLRQAARHEQLREAREAAHALKGSSLTVGAQRLAYAADVAEKMARLGQARELRGSVDQVAVELEQADAELRRQMGVSPG